MEGVGWVRTAGDGAVVVSLRVQPRASRTGLAGILDGQALRVRVAAPPVDSAANEALVRFLADALDLPRSAIQLRRGAASRRKEVAIHGRTAAEVVARLGGGGWRRER
ncbi:MAG: DUF167 domain-containing protein [Verrucomicrobiota bacterium]